MILYYKGKFLDSEDFDINEKLFRGIGVFETIKFCNNLLLFFLDHIDRLFSNTFFNFSTINREQLYLDSLEIINRNSLSKGLIKIIVIPTSDDWDEFYNYGFRCIQNYLKEEKLKRLKYLLHLEYPWSYMILCTYLKIVLVDYLKFHLG